MSKMPHDEIVGVGWLSKGGLCCHSQLVPLVVRTVQGGKLNSVDKNDAYHLHPLNGNYGIQRSGFIILDKRKWVWVERGLAGFSMSQTPLLPSLLTHKNTT